MRIDFHGIWKQLPSAWDAAQPQFWRVAHNAVAEALPGQKPDVVDALTQDVVEDFRVLLCGARTFKGLQKEINLANWQTILHGRASEAADLNRESIATGDYWRLRPLKQGDPQAWVDIKLSTDEAVRQTCEKVISSHEQRPNWMPIWLSSSDEFIEAITAEFKRNGIHRCQSWNDLIPHLGRLAKYRIRDHLIRKTKRELPQSTESGDEDWDVFWRKREPGYLNQQSADSPDIESHFVREDLLNLLKAAGVPQDFAALVIEHECDGLPVKDLCQRLADPVSPATFYARLGDGMEAVETYARDPDNQRRWRGTVIDDATAVAQTGCDNTTRKQSNLK